MTWTVRTAAGLCALTWAFGCGKSAAPEPETAGESEPTAQSGGTAATGEPAQTPVAADGSSAAAAEDPIALAERLCNQLCEEVKGTCTPRQAQFCQASCPDWVGAAKQCPIEVEEALTCQTSADRYLLCSNVATATCAPLYKTLSECRDGKRPAKTEKGSPPPAAVPPGYAKHTLPSLGGYFLLPEGPLDEQTADRVVRDRPPHKYLIERVKQVPSKELTDMTVLQIARPTSAMRASRSFGSSLVSRRATSPTFASRRRARTGPNGPASSTSSPARAWQPRCAQPLAKLCPATWIPTSTVSSRRSLRRSVTTTSSPDAISQRGRSISDISGHRPHFAARSRRIRASMPT